MTTQAVSIELAPRAVLGKKVKALRRSGIIPVNVYGAGMESRALQCEERTLLRALNAAGGEAGPTDAGDHRRGGHAIPGARRRHPVEPQDWRRVSRRLPFCIGLTLPPGTALQLTQIPLVNTGRSVTARSVNKQEDVHVHGFPQRIR